jgi:serine/threonine protein kinase
MKIPGYKLHRKIGKGGMATVFLATQQSFERKVALKIIADSAFGSSELAERFQREAKIVARLSHPHIVPVYDVGRVENIHFLAMDYLPGGDLNSFIRAGLQPREAEQILSQLAQALHFAHSKGYIHRDVKPDNIMFREDNSAVLTDFGIARPIKTATDITNKGLVIGTPAFMSPEQSQGKETDGRADLYSLGVIFYKMLTTKLPFTADEPLALAIKHIKEPIPKLPEELASYQPIIEQLMAKDPAERFESGLALCKALAGLDRNDMRTARQGNQAVENTSTLQITQPEIALQAIEKSTSSPQSGITIEESSYRKLGVAKRYAFQCQLSSDDPQHFTVLFGQFTTRLMEWHEANGKQCGILKLDITITERLLPRVLQLIEELNSQDASETFAFLQKLQFDVHIRDFKQATLKTAQY